MKNYFEVCLFGHRTFMDRFCAFQIRRGTCESQSKLRRQYRYRSFNFSLKKTYLTH